MLNRLMEQWFGEKTFRPLSPEESEKIWNKIQARLAVSDAKG